jgi:hypothetical protein
MRLAWKGIVLLIALGKAMAGRKALPPCNVVLCTMHNTIARHKTAESRLLHVALILRNRKQTNMWFACFHCLDFVFPPHGSSSELIQVLCLQSTVSESSHQGNFHLVI